VIILNYIRSTFLGGVKKTRKYRVLEYTQKQTYTHIYYIERITLDARTHNGILYEYYYYDIIYLPTVRIIFYYTVTGLLFFFRLKWTVPTAFIVLWYNTARTLFAIRLYHINIIISDDYNNNNNNIISSHFFVVVSDVVASRTGLLLNYGVKCCTISLLSACILCAYTDTHTHTRYLYDII
jgi:hypothetical protein